MANAKIQVTVKLDDIPKEIKNRITDLNDTMINSQKLFKQLVEETQNKNFITSAGYIQKIREDFAYVDSVLSDCYNVMSGYIKYQSSLIEQLEEKQQEKQIDTEKQIPQE